MSDIIETRPRRSSGGKKTKMLPEVIPQPPDHSSFLFGFHADRNYPSRRTMEVLHFIFYFELLKGSVVQDDHLFLYDFNGERDQGLFAIFDGHGGKTAAQWCAQNMAPVLPQTWLDTYDCVY